MFALRPRIFLVLTALAVACFGPVQQAAAQNTSTPVTGDQAVYRDGKVNVPLTDEYQVGVLFHTQGIGITARRGYYLNAFAVRNIGVDLAYFKHPKEIQTTNPIYENGRPYVYGKQNTLQILRLWYGKQNLRAEKLRRDAVRFSTFWKVGAALGVLKPIYLEIGYPDIPYDYTATERYDPDALTAREQEVLELMVKGVTSNRKLASELNVSENTVKFHVRNILDKLHLHNRAQVVAYALRHGMVELPAEEES